MHLQQYPDWTNPEMLLDQLLDVRLKQWSCSYMIQEQEQKKLAAAILCQHLSDTDKASPGPGQDDQSRARQHPQGACSQQGRWAARW